MALGLLSIGRVGSSDNPLINALLNSGWRFKDGSAGQPPLTQYALAASNPALGNTVASKPEIIDYVFDWSWGIPHNPQREANQIASVNSAFQAWENVANIDLRMGPRWTFSNYDAGAEIVLHRTSPEAIGGFAGYSGTAGQATQVTHDEWTDEDGDHSIHVADRGRVHTHLATEIRMRGNADNPEFMFDPTTGAAGPAGMTLIMHEIGHALGLKHPHDAGAMQNAVFLPGVPQNDSDNTGAALNNGIGLNHKLNTIMSYNWVKTTLTDPIGRTAVNATPMAFDIAAIQHLYGANRSFNKGNSSYELTDAAWRCIWDAGGTDEIFYNGSVDAVINLNHATLTNSRDAGGLPSFIKSTTTSGPNNGANAPTGGIMIAADVTNALADVNGVTGVIIENARGGSGRDDITGNGANNKLYGNNGNDILKGLGGNDALDAGIGDDFLDGGVGADAMRGGAGWDVYIVDNVGDAAIELAGSAGIDEVRAAVSFTLGANIEYLVLTNTSAWTTLQAAPIAPELEAAVNTDTFEWHGVIGTSPLQYAFVGLTGLTNALDLDLDLEVEIIDEVPNINGTGNNLGNIIIGNAGNNVIDGRAGADRMTGGLGDDTYYVDNPDDVVREAVNAGTDTVISTVTWTLSNSVENLTLAGNAAINGTGNVLNNVIVGNARNNILEGGGGKDKITGGLGNDTFVFRSTADTGVWLNADVIHDFEDGRDNDAIDLSGLDGTLTFSSASLFSGVANEVIAVQSGADVVIRINTGGTIAAEAEILLANTLLSQIDATDFLL